MRAVARLRNYPTSPFKMRLLADLVRNKSVDRSLVILENSPRHGARPLYRLLLSALSNWKQKNPGADEQRVVVTRITVDGGRAMRRVLPAPQGNAHWIKKRSHHIFVEVGVPDGLNSSKEPFTPRLIEIFNSLGACIFVEYLNVSTKNGTTSSLYFLLTLGVYPSIA